MPIPSPPLDLEARETTRSGATTPVQRQPSQSPSLSEEKELQLSVTAKKFSESRELSLTIPSSPLPCAASALGGPQSSNSTGEEGTTGRSGMDNTDAAAAASTTISVATCAAAASSMQDISMSALNIDGREEKTFSMLPTLHSCRGGDGAAGREEMQPTDEVVLPSNALPQSGQSMYDTSGSTSIATRPVSVNQSRQGLYLEQDAMTAQAGTCGGAAGESYEDAKALKKGKRRLKKKAAAEKNIRVVDATASMQGVTDTTIAPPVVSLSPQEVKEQKKYLKKLKKQEKLKAMPSEERRQYKADHRVRRAAKKAMRAGVDTATATDVAMTVGPTVPITEEVVTPEAAPPSVPFGVGETVAQAADFSSPTGPPLTSQSTDASSPSTMAPVLAEGDQPKLYNTCRDGNEQRAQMLQGVLNQVRRCTSAGGPTVTLSTQPNGGTFSTPPPFRRRFVSETGDMVPPLRSNSFLHLSTRAPTDGTPQLDDDPDNESLLQTNQLYGEGAPHGTSFSSSVDGLVAHAPSAVAGSAASAVMELKQQYQQQLQVQASPLPSSGGGGSSAAGEATVAPSGEFSTTSASGLIGSHTARPLSQENRRSSQRDAASLSSSYYSSYTDTHTHSTYSHQVSCSSLGGAESRSSNSPMQGRRGSVDSGSYTYSSSGSSSSSSGALVAKVLPLKAGCTVPPPTRAFSDLKYRLSCVAQLAQYAEPAIIHEWNLVDGCWGSVETSVVLCPEPFSMGNMRASYYMIDMGRPDCMLVAKRYLKTSVGDDQYFDDVSMHSISGHWARVFNAVNPPKKVRFVPAAVLLLPKRDPPLIMAMEPQLTGRFIKYNNNCGYVRRNARWTPQAFSHFTYHASGHELIIVDIQGVDDYYTDPQILSPDGEGYGRGNLGRKGIQRFLDSHRCNSVCKAIGLPPLVKTSKGVIAPPSAGNSCSALSPLEGRRASPMSLREERLPPKSFSSLRRSSSGNMSGTPVYGGNSGSSVRSSGRDSRTNGESLLMTSQSPPRQLALPSGRGSGVRNTTGPSSPAAPMSSLQVAPRAFPQAPADAKFSRFPRQALIRPQATYFTSTIGNGTMVVPSTATTNYLQRPGDVAAAGAAGAAVPLLRPPAQGRSLAPQTALDNVRLLSTQVVPPMIPSGLASNITAGIRTSRGVANGSGGEESCHSTPHHSSNGPMLFPHPPTTGKAGMSNGHRNLPAPSLPTKPILQPGPDGIQAGRVAPPPPRRTSFSRRPIFSAMEEQPSYTKRRKK